MFRAAPGERLHEELVEPEACVRTPTAVELPGWDRLIYEHCEAHVLRLVP